MMVESNLLGGRQDLRPGEPLVYGRSITDGCIDWDTSVAMLERLARAVEQRCHVHASRRVPVGSAAI
jgi:3-deoxy-7-phosphoheptulonate synthase